MRKLLNALALSTAALAMPTIGAREVSDPKLEEGPIGNYDRRAIRAAEAERKRQKYAEKMARRAARRG